ncbi:MAG: DUF885 family protein, partial [Gemmatimonadota bacterium]|nr:DUF885 family protein [Gemmatimonadota bacterium]
MTRTMLQVATTALLLLVLPASTRGQEAGWSQDPPALQDLVAFDRTQSDLRVAVQRFEEDRRALGRRWDVPYSPVRRERYRRFYEGWTDALEDVDFGALNHEGQVDYVLMRTTLEFELEMLRQEASAMEEMAPLVPFARSLGTLQEDRRNRDAVDPRTVATVLHEVANQVESLTAAIRSGQPDLPPIKAVAAGRAASFTSELRQVLEGWHRFYDGYDPLFTWWAAEPYERLDAALEEYAAAIRDHLVGDAGSGPVIGDPIGEEGLEAHLAHEMIPYSGEELIAIAEAEFAWMEEALLEASREMGYGDDWKAAQEAVKEGAVEPGLKPAVVRELAAQSVSFIGERDWITMPPLAEEIWRMEMMPPERQLVNPFFLGGETIRISYPTDDMAHDAKLMSMRG